MTNFLIDYTILFILILLLDSIFLNLMSGKFNDQISLIQGQTIELKYFGVILFYLLFTLGIYYFGVKKNLNLLDIFILGLFAYGTFELTNYSIFKDWKLSTVLIDTLWGGVLLSSVVYLFRMIKNIM